MIFKLKLLNFENISVSIFIASLPFYTFRFIPGGFSLTHILFSLIALLGLMKILHGKLFLNKIDIGILIYLLIITSNILFNSIYDKDFEFIKIITYFICYFLFKQLYYSFKECDKQFALISGSIIGIIAFSILLFKTMLTYNIYYNTDNLMFVIYKNIFIENNLSNDFHGRQIMKSVVGEVFALYALILYALINEKTKKSIFLIPSIFVVLMESLRSYISLLSIMVKQNTNKKILTVIFALMALIIFKSAIMSTIETGIFGFSEEGIYGNERLKQIRYVINNLDFNQLILGQGFASKIDDRFYVHNFIFSSFYTLGLLGLLISCYIFFIILKKYIKLYMLHRYNNFGLFLIIPILGLLVGSTVEGVFTIPEWICLAIFNTKICSS